MLFLPLCYYVVSFSLLFVVLVGLPCGCFCLLWLLLWHVVALVCCCTCLRALFFVLLSVAALVLACRCFSSLLHLPLRLVERHLFELAIFTECRTYWQRMNGASREQKLQENQVFVLYYARGERPRPARAVHFIVSVVLVGWPCGCSCPLLLLLWLAVAFIRCSTCICALLGYTFSS